MRSGYVKARRALMGEKLVMYELHCHTHGVIAMKRTDCSSILLLLLLLLLPPH